MADPVAKQHSPGIVRENFWVLMGFIGALGIGIATLIYGLNQREDSFARVNEIINVQTVKLQLLAKMRLAARERTIALFNMVYQSDPFIQDEWFLEFNRQGAMFAQSRIQLTSMQLSDPEKSLLREQGELTSLAIPAQISVIDLIQNQNIEKARKVLVERAVPFQNNVFVVIEKYQTLLQKNINSEIETINRSQKMAHDIIIIFGSGSVLIGLFLAISVLRKISRHSHQLHYEKVLAQVTLGSIGDAVITTDAHGLVNFMNIEAEKLTGWSSEEAHGLPLPNVMQIIDKKKEKLRLNPVLEAINLNKRIISSANTYMIDRNRNRYAIEHTANPIRDESKQVYGGVLVFRDVTQTRALAEQLSHQASHDALTGLINRREFEIRLKQAIANAQAEGSKYALLYLDLDQFKIINDMGGHIAGDELLKQLAQTMRKMLRESDSLARLGGDEFGILLDGCPIEKAREIAESIRDTIDSFKFYWEGNIFEIGASIGLVMISEDSGTITEVMSAVDTACYTAKDLGRNRIQVYQPGNQELNKRRNEMYWSQRLNTAINNNNLCLYVQEIRSINGTGDKKHMEVLLRLRDSGDQIINPNLFLPAAERFALMNSLDKWVIKNTLRIISEMKINSMQNPRYQFNINLSGQSINTHDMLGFIIKSFEETKINPRMVCFEVTETMAISNLATARRFISMLKGHGCGFALDDFGKGLSSFTYLKHIPVDAIKIDGSFVKDIVDDQISGAFIEAINQIAHVMGIRTVAEYVENEAIYNAILKTKVDYMQGHYVAPPMPIEDIKLAN